MTRSAYALVVVAICVALAGAGTAQAQAPSLDINPLAEPFKVLAAQVGGPMAESTEWLRVYAGAVIDDWDTVRGDAEKLIARFPASAEARIALAVGLEGTGDREGAVAALRKAVELDPKQLTGWLMLVQLNFRLDRLKDAALALEQARALAPDNVGILMSLAKAYVRLGDAERAARVLAGATKADPGNVEAWVNYLATAARTNMADAAWREFDQLKAAHPEVAAAVAKRLPGGVTRPGSPAPAK